jgi:hypothetical protein
MRTTLAIDDDVLAAARDIATRQSRSVGAVMSDPARQSLPRPTVEVRANGIPCLPITNSKAVITLELVNALRDELP